MPNRLIFFGFQSQLFNPDVRRNAPALQFQHGRTFGCRRVLVQLVMHGIFSGTPGSGSPVGQTHPRRRFSLESQRPVVTVSLEYQTVTHLSPATCTGSFCAPGARYSNSDTACKKSPASYRRHGNKCNPYEPCPCCSHPSPHRAFSP